MVRAGQAIRFDGSDSYSIDTSANLTNFAWTFGDGSTGVNGATSHQDHTYATAGEYMATLIVTDSTGTVKAHMPKPSSKSCLQHLSCHLHYRQSHRHLVELERLR